MTKARAVPYDPAPRIEMWSGVVDLVVGVSGREFMFGRRVEESEVVEERELR